MKFKPRRIVTENSFWVVAAMLTGITLIHYISPQIRLLSSEVEVFLSRHAVERIIFVLPVAAATFAFGQAGGLIVLALAVLAMLPRAIWLSPQPADALFETAATGVVGYLIVWMLETQEREKRLRQKAAEELGTVNTIASTVSQSLDLEDVLNKALVKVLETSEITGKEPRGGIFLLSGEDQKLQVHQRLSPASILLEAEAGVRKHLPKLTTESLEVIFDRGLPVHADKAQQERLGPYVIVPLRARDHTLGVLLLTLREGYVPSEEDKQLLVSIASQIGMAVDNARLYENLRYYVREITRTQEKERKRIAQEIHDETIQILIAVSRRLEAVSMLPAGLPPEAIYHLEQLQELTGRTIKGIRRFIQDLRPPVLDHLGLVAALEGLVDEAKERSNIETELAVIGEIQRLSPEEELTLFRIAQEALNNSGRHAHASRATLQIEFEPGRIRMTIEDNGCGFDAPERISDLVPTGRLGLIGMHERTRILRGTLAIQSEPGKGTTITVDIPVHHGPEEDTAHLG